MKKSKHYFVLIFLLFSVVSCNMHIDKSKENNKNIFFNADTHKNIGFKLLRDLEDDLPNNNFVRIPIDNLSSEVMEYLKKRTKKLTGDDFSMDYLEITKGIVQEDRDAMLEAHEHVEYDTTGRHCPHSFSSTVTCDNFFEPCPSNSYYTVYSAMISADIRIDPDRGTAYHQVIHEKKRICSITDDEEYPFDVNCCNIVKYTTTVGHSPYFDWDKETAELEVVNFHETPENTLWGEPLYAEGKHISIFAKETIRLAPGFIAEKDSHFTAKIIPDE